MAKKTYTALPVIPPELAARYEVMVAVMSGTLTVSEGARRLGLSRNHFQSLLHRALGSLIGELGPKAGGRPPTPPRERQLEEETGRLRLENERLQRRVETAERILGVASGLLRGRMDRGARRERGPKTPATEDE
jgi:AraC-like DNA-binding protein